MEAQRLGDGIGVGVQTRPYASTVGSDGIQARQSTLLRGTLLQDGVRLL